MAFQRKRTKKIRAESQPAESNEDPLYTVRIASSEPGIDVGLYSAVGDRAGQQDAARVSDDYYYARTNTAFAVLCDGMGGLSGGERASQLSVTALYETFQRLHELPAQEIQQFYKTMIRRLDAMVHGLKDESGNLLGAGTTLTSIFLQGEQLYWSAVGDSRIYLLHGDTIQCLTEDHNYYKLLKERVKRGLISREEADREPKKEALISYIGIGGVEYINLCENPITLQKGDCVLLCSDGLYRTLSEAEILHILHTATEPMSVAAQRLVDAAIAKHKRHQDNTTVVVLKFGAQA